MSNSIRHSACVMSSEYVTRTSLYLDRLKILEWMKFLERHFIQRNCASRNFRNCLACEFTANYTCKNAQRGIWGAFHSTKIPVWNFGNFTSSMERYIPVAQTRPKPPCVLFVPSQQTQNLYTLKEKSKYCLYPKEHSTVQKGRWITKGRGILFRVESLWKQVKVKNSRELTAPEIP